jgi:hypothetical protein
MVSAEDWNGRDYGSVVKMPPHEFRRRVGLPKAQRDLDGKYAKSLGLDIQSVESPWMQPISLMVAPNRRTKNLDGTGPAEFLLVDGQHRAAAIMEMTQYNLPCLIIGLPPKVNVAKIFVILNNKKTVNPNLQIANTTDGYNLWIQDLNRNPESPLRGKIYLGRKVSLAKGKPINAVKIRTILKKTHSPSVGYLRRHPSILRDYGLPRLGLYAAMWEEKTVPFLKLIYDLKGVNPTWTTISLVRALWEIYLRMDYFRLSDMRLFFDVDPTQVVSRNETGLRAVHTALQYFVPLIAKRVPRNKWKQMGGYVSAIKFDIDLYA